MEISELLRRGNFNRSQIFVSHKQVSQQSLNEQDALSNFNNSKSPSKVNLMSKSSMNNTRITDHSNSSQVGKEQYYFIKKKSSNEFNSKRQIRNSSQVSFNDESLFHLQDQKKGKNNQSTLGLQSAIKSDTLLSQTNYDEEIIPAPQNSQQQGQRMTHKKILSMDQYSISHRGQGVSNIYPQSQQQSRRNVESKSFEQEKLQEILAKSQLFKSPDKGIQKRGLSGKSTINFGQFSGKSNISNKKLMSDIFSSTTLKDTFKQDNGMLSPMPKTTKQSTFLESAKQQQKSAPYFKGIKSEGLSNEASSTTQNFRSSFKEDEGKKDLLFNPLAYSLIENSNEEKDKKIEFKNTTISKNYRSQEKYQAQENSSTKKNQPNINPFAPSIKGGNEKNIASFRKKNSQENLQIGKLRSPIQEYFAEDEMKGKVSNNNSLTSNQLMKTINKMNQSQVIQEVSDQIPAKPQQGGFKISSIMGIVRMKKKVSEIVKRNQVQMNNNNQKGSDGSDADTDRHLRKRSIKDKFQLHSKIVHDLKNEQGCEIHDIYGTFNDKIKQIQEQVYESINDYQLANTVIEQVEKEKKQSRVIDAVENTIQSIFLSLDYLEKIPNVMNEREEIDKILAQQAISLMKSTQANLVIQIETVMIYAKYCKAICNFGKALRLYKQCKNMSISPLMQRYRMKSYKSIGICFQNLKLYTTSLLYFGKYLESAWYVGDTEAELKAYDLLGVTHYLLGDLDTAKFYHEKMIQNDNEPADSDVRTLNVKKMVEKLKKLNTEEYLQKMAVSYKKFFAKIHSIDYEEDYECSSSDDEFKISIPKTSSQKKNQEYEQYLRELSPNAKKKLESEKKRFIAIYNAEDRVAQKQIKVQANSNIRMLEYKRIAFQLPSQLKFSSAKSFKPINSTQKSSFRINQFSINRNLDNYMAQDQRITKFQNFDFFKQVEDNNDKKLKNKIIYILSKFQNNLIFALSQIHCMRERDKYRQNKRRFAFSGVADFNKPNNLILMNINISQEKMQQVLEEKKRVKQMEDKSKPNSNKQKFLFIQRFQMHPEVEALFKN